METHVFRLFSDAWKVTKILVEIYLTSAFAKDIIILNI